MRCSRCSGSRPTSSTPRSTRSSRVSRRQVRHRHVVVHRYQAARGEGQLHRLLHRRRVVLQGDGGKTVAQLVSICGLKVAVESATTEQTDATTQSTKCVTADKPAVDVQTFPDQNSANLAVAYGPRAARLRRLAGRRVPGQQSHGKFKLVGVSFANAPYGIAVPKSSGDLDKAILVGLPSGEDRQVQADPRQVGRAGGSDRRRRPINGAHELAPLRRLWGPARPRHHGRARADRAA